MSKQKGPQTNNTFDPDQMVLDSFFEDIRRETSLDPSRLAYALDYLEAHRDEFALSVDDDPRGDVEQMVVDGDFANLTAYVLRFNTALHKCYDLVHEKRLDRIPYRSGHRYIKYSDLFRDDISTVIDTNFNFPPTDIARFIERLSEVPLPLGAGTIEYSGTFEYVLWSMLIAEKSKKSYFQDKILSLKNTQVGPISMTATISKYDFCLYSDGSLLLRINVQDVPSKIIYFLVQQFLTLVEDHRNPLMLLDNYTNQENALFTTFFKNPDDYILILDRDKTYVKDYDAAVQIMTERFGFDQDHIDEILAGDKEIFKQYVMYIHITFDKEKDCFMFGLGAINNETRQLIEETYIPLPTEHFNAHKQIALVQSFTGVQDVIVHKSIQTFSLDQPF